MPCRYIIDKDKRLVVTSAWDRLTFAEAKAHQDQLSTDPAFNPEYSQLIDATGVTELDISANQAQALASRVIFSAQSRRAFVATNPITFGMARLMGAHDEIARAPEKADVFSTRDAALRWLGLESAGPVLRDSRRSTRVRLKVQIKAQGVAEPLTCEGETVVVNRHGALILTDIALRVPVRIEIRVILTEKRALAKVVYIDPDHPRHCGIALENPQNIWGVSPPPNDWLKDETQ
jgi:hypothetical protein